ncbi:unnamed protein product [Mycena citricolor]|uniref:Asl1-like glycosyl hydrolase catalytic domain-containing protein n=1 Tax=Mycena citricolor TaxID=2018698 RepID=A0AAD2JUU0_9AGAR|nr:unnamed protein product [Mycena citricolor]
MAPTRFLTAVTLVVAGLLSVSTITPVNAIALEPPHVVRSHHAIAQHKHSGVRKRTNASRCKPKSSSLHSSSTQTSTSSTETSTSTYATTTTHAAPTTTTTHAAPTTTTTHAAPTTAKPPPSPTTSKQAVATQAPGKSTGGSGLRGKACLAWPNSNFNPLAPWIGSTVGLIYSWDATKVPGAEELGLTYAPMLWGWKNAEDFKAKAVKGYSNIALGCNEPNEAGQSNMDPYSGISLWQQYMLPLANEGYTLISCATSSNPNGKVWMKTFFDNCGDCKVGGIAVHYYGTDIEDFKNYVTYWHTTYNLPVYITEYADQDFNNGPQADMGQIWAFLQAATQFANENDWIHAHCWFGAMKDMTNVNTLNTLMVSDGSGPNALGNWFINN